MKAINQQKTLRESSIAQTLIFFVDIGIRRNAGVKIMEIVK